MHRPRVSRSTLTRILLVPLGLAMKLFPATAWFAALRNWRGQRGAGQDPAEMGTAFGLDSITIVDFGPTSIPDESDRSAAALDWPRRLARRSGL